MNRKLEICSGTCRVKMPDGKFMEMSRRSDSTVSFRTYSLNPKGEEVIEMDWDFMTLEEVKSLYHLITQPI